MKCFYHPDVDAVGICLACNRGLCAECAVEMERGLACKNRCEHEVRRLLDVRDFSYAQPHHEEAAMKQLRAGHLRVGVVNLAIGSALLVTWYIYGQGILAAIGGLLVILGVLILFTGRSKVRSDQFRLCPKCGYNITGNTSGKCPECGHLV